MTRLTIDLRMYRHSGIGRYLRNVMPQVVPLLRAEAIRIVTNPGLIGDADWLRDKRVEVFETDALVYSIGEQLLPLRGAYRATSLLWVPHYNAPLGYRGRLALTIHDVAPMALPEIMGNAVRAGYAKLLIERAVGRAEAILCDSAYTAEELVRLVRADAAKLTVVHLGLEETWAAGDALPLEVDAAPYLLYVGNVKPNKNLTLLLQAFAQVQDRLPHRLVLAGRMRGFGTSDEGVLRQAESLGPRVQFTDEITDEELIGLYANADALVLPSLYEGFGLPLLEAMQLGCPVMSSNATSLPEIGGAAAIYFDPRDVGSLVECLLRVTDVPLMESLRRKGRLRASEFSYTRCAEQTAGVLNGLLAAG